jgi:hypothetical protein
VQKARHRSGNPAVKPTGQFAGSSKLRLTIGSKPRSLLSEFSLAVNANVIPVDGSVPLVAKKVDPDLPCSIDGNALRYELPASVQRTTGENTATSIPGSYVASWAVAVAPGKAATHALTMYVIPGELGEIRRR